MSADDRPTRPNATGELVTRVAAAGVAREAGMAPSARKERGVVHTPVEVARFVARALDAMVRDQLEVPDGIADARVLLIDPCCGPGVFVAAALELIADRKSRPAAVLGLDIDASAIESASALLDPEAEACGVRLVLSQHETLSSLSPHPLAQDPDLIRVIIGNPPWAGRSANRGGECTEELLETWRRDADGEPLRERKIGVLSDDYVRFFRWAAEMVAGEAGGALALVTNASFLDGRVHRGMRASLSRQFDQLDHLDLGGSALVARDARRDDNVFGVRPSVAISIAGRRRGVEPRCARVRIARLRGSLVDKLARLRDANTLDAFAPRQVPSPELGPRFHVGVEVPAEWNTWPSLEEWMPFHREGLQSNRDDLVIDSDLDALHARLHAFAAGDKSLARSTRHWNEAAARASASRILLPDSEAVHASFGRLAYRPLDTRWVCVDPALCHRPRLELLAAMKASRFALVTANKDRGEVPWRHAAAVAEIPDNCFLSARSSCRARAFPTRDPAGAENFAAARRSALEIACGTRLSADDFAAWALLFISSVSYQERYVGALRGELPRVPPPHSHALFVAGVAVGRALLDAWLDEATPDPCVRLSPDPPSGKGRLRADAAHGAIVMGRRKIAEGIAPAALELVIGHHHPLPRLAGRAPHIDEFARAVSKARQICEAQAAADTFLLSNRVFQPAPEPATMRP